LHLISSDKNCEKLKINFEDIIEEPNDLIEFESFKNILSKEKNPQDTYLEYCEKIKNKYFSLHSMKINTSIHLIKQEDYDNNLIRADFRFKP
jgi:hypothetical protein